MTYKFLDFDGLKHFYDTYIKKKVDNDGDISNTKSTFTQASSRTNLVSGETLKTSLGKIMKFFADLKTVAFSGSYNDLSNKPTSLPANGGDADTVGGKSAATLQAYANLTGKPTIVNNLTTTTTNTVLDGRQGKALNDKITTLNSTLTVKTVLRDEGANLNVYQAVYGKIAQVRAASNLKATIPSAEKRQLYQLDIEPVYPIYRRYTLTGTTGFIIEISADSILTLTPFGGDLAKDTAINFTETFLIK